MSATTGELTRGRRDAPARGIAYSLRDAVFSCWGAAAWPARLAAIIVIALAFIALAGPWIVPHDPDAVDLAIRLEPASATHWLGTDHLGRDILSRLMIGAGASLGSVVAAMALILSAGLVLGGAAGFAGGRTDQIIMRIADVFLTFPTIVMALFMIGMLGTGLTNVIIAIAVTHWAWYARMVRGIVLSLRRRDFIAASRLAGASPVQTFLRHLLPATMAQLLVLATLDIGHIMLHVSGLSFLGLGVAAPAAEWGVMLSDARQYIWTEPLLAFWPGLALFISVMALNTLGDALRDRLDPTLNAEHSH